MPRKLLVILISIILIMFPLLLLVSPGLAAPIEESDPATQVLQLVNEWRIQEGLWPLRLSSTLQTMAQAQAEYVQPRLDAITDEIDYHKDSQGRLPPERARQDYQWPLISSPVASPTVRVGENAAVGSPKYALNFWKSSDIHRRAALNNLYHDVGVGVVATKIGYVFIMDFGARPDGIAVLTSLRGDKLYLANDCLCGLSGTITNTKIRLFNAKGAPVTDTMDWKPVLGIDASWGSTLLVLYTNGTRQEFVSVEVGKDIAVLSRSSGSGAPLQPTSTPTPIPLPVLFQPSATPSAPTSSTVSAPTNAPAVTPIFTPTSASKNVSTDKPTTPADLVLLYNSDTFIMFNNNKRSIDLTGLAFGNTTSRVSIGAWKAVASFSDTSFPTANCLQAGIGATTLKNDCKFVRSSVYLSASKMFWLSGTFKVTQNDATIGECDATLNRCEVWMKFAVSANQSVSGKQ